MKEKTKDRSSTMNGEIIHTADVKGFTSSLGSWLEDDKNYVSLYSICIIIAIVTGILLSHLF
jgi:hypothetical protein